ncbi:MAG: electron transfer flavoprotein subunit alpha/FixB family protein [Elusimicrobiota bacterium]
MNKTLIITSKENFNEISFFVHQKGAKPIIAVIFSSNNIDIEKTFVDKAYLLISDNILDLDVNSIKKIIDFEKPSLIISDSTLLTKFVIAKLSIKLGCGVLTDCFDYKQEDKDIIALKYAYGSEAVAKLRLRSKIKIITLSKNKLDNRISGEKNTEYQYITPEYMNLIKKTYQELKQSKLPIDKANKVIGIGRGVDPQDFEIIKEFAHKINATIGYTRPVVCDGLGDCDFQIGITGKIISPKLYIAIGISGKEHHIKGVENAKTIISINKDPNAPIKEYSDYFICADYKKVIEILKDN